MTSQFPKRMLSSERYSTNKMNMIYDNLYLELDREVEFQINSEVP